MVYLWQGNDEAVARPTSSHPRPLMQMGAAGLKARWLSKKPVRCTRPSALIEAIRARECGARPGGVSGRAIPVGRARLGQCARFGTRGCEGTSAICRARAPRSSKAWDARWDPVQNRNRTLILNVNFPRDRQNTSPLKMHKWTRKNAWVDEGSGVEE